MLCVRGPMCARQTGADVKCLVIWVCSCSPWHNLVSQAMPALRPRFCRTVSGRFRVAAERKQLVPANIKQVFFRAVEVGDSHLAGCAGHQLTTQVTASA